MASTYAGNAANYPAAVRYAEDGDAPNETGMIAPTMEDLADRTASLHAIIGADVGTGDLEIDGEVTFNGPTTHNSTTNFVTPPEVSSSTTRARACGSPTCDPDDWRSNAPGWVSRTGNSGGSGIKALRFPVLIPHGATITSVSVYVNPAGAHASLPATKFTLRLVVHGVANSVSSSEATIASQQDPAASLVAYEAEHAVTLSGLSHTVDNEGRSYWVCCENESGANSIEAGLVCYEPVVTFTNGAV